MLNESCFVGQTGGEVVLTHNHQSRGGFRAFVRGNGGRGPALSLDFTPSTFSLSTGFPLHHSAIHVLPLSFVQQLSSSHSTPQSHKPPLSCSEAQPHPTDMELNDTCFQVRTASQWGMEKKGERGKVLKRKRALIKREREREGWWVIHRAKLEDT